MKLPCKASRDVETAYWWYPRLNKWTSVFFGEVGGAEPLANFRRAGIGGGRSLPTSETLRFWGREAQSKQQGSYINNYMYMCITDIDTYIVTYTHFESACNVTIMTTRKALNEKHWFRKWAPQAWITCLCRRARFQKVRVEGTIRMNVSMNGRSKYISLFSCSYCCLGTTIFKIRKESTLIRILYFLNQCHGCTIKL